MINYRFYPTTSWHGINEALNNKQSYTVTLWKTVFNIRENNVRTRGLQLMFEKRAAEDEKGRAHFSWVIRETGAPSNQKQAISISVFADEPRCFSYCFHRILSHYSVCHPHIQTGEPTDTQRKFLRPL